MMLLGLDVWWLMSMVLGSGAVCWLLAWGSFVSGDLGSCPVFCMALVVLWVWGLGFLPYGL